MAIDLGNTPTGTPPTAGEKLQIRSAIGVGTTDAPTFNSVNITNTATANVFSTSAAALQTSGYLGVARAINLIDTAGISWSSTSTLLGATGTNLLQDAPGILAQRNVGTAQTFRVYNSTDATPATNFDRASFGFPTGTNTLRIGTENSGTTGYTTARPIEFVTGGVVRMSIGATGAIGIGIAATSAILDIRGANSVAGAVQIGSLNTNIGNFISLHGSGTNGAAVRIFSNYWNTEGALLLGTYNNQSTLCIATGGKVGIGTVSPTSSLQVSGGDIEVETVTNGLILKAAGTSTRYRLTLNAGGTALVFTAV